MNYSVNRCEAYIINWQYSIILIRLVDRLDLKNDLKIRLGLGNVFPEDLEGAYGGTVGHTTKMSQLIGSYLVEFLM